VAWVQNQTRLPSPRDASRLPKSRSDSELRNGVPIWCAYNRAERKRKAFPITDTELRLMAAAAIAGLNSNPVNG